MIIILTRKIITIILIASFLSWWFLLWPKYALAAFPTDNFDSYTAGDLNTQGGAGGGWSGAWGVGAGLNCGAGVDVGTAQFVSSPNSITWTANGDECERLLSSTLTTDTVSVQMRRSNATDGSNVYWTVEDAAGLNGWIVQMTGTGDVIQVIGATTETCGGGSSFSVNTWYKVTLNFDTTGTGLGKCKVGAADYGPTVAESASVANIGRFGVSDGGGAGGFLDDIETTVTAAAVEDILYAPIWFFNEI